MKTSAHVSMKPAILQTMELIARDELDNENIKLGDAGYINQRALISSLFKGDFCKGQVILRLTVIDSLYSTNAAYSYFSFEEMADRIYQIGDQLKDPAEKQTAVRDYFYHVAQTGNDERDLFAEPYGMQKNLVEGKKQMSLLSKYAYYELLQEPEKYPLGFPIYDRLAKEAYPTVCKMLGETYYYTMPQLETPTIKEYITALSQLRTALWGKNKELFLGKYQQYDILDAYLWRMGKFTDGNLSLLLGREDYQRFILNLGIAAPYNKKQEREATAEYTHKLNKMYADLNHQKEVKKCDFNTLIACILEHTDNVFAGIENESYMNALLVHWKDFQHSKGLPPKRGISFQQ